MNGEDGLEGALSWKKEIKIDLSVERNCNESKIGQRLALRNIKDGSNIGDLRIK